MSIGIYKYQNKINGKIYIDQSSNIEKHFAQHLYDSKNLDQGRGTGIDFAISKYGIENFDFEIIEKCDSVELDEKEIFWIKYYNSYEEGYNRTPGGDSMESKLLNSMAELSKILKQVRFLNQLIQLLNGLVVGQLH